MPKLAEVFGISTDELLGIERKEVQPAEIVSADDAERDVHNHPEMTWELSLDGGKKGSIGLAVWILLVGGIMLAVLLLLGNVTFFLLDRLLSKLGQKWKGKR